MTKKEDYEKKTEQLLIPMLDRNHFELVDVEYVKEGSNYYLRSYIDKEGGITIDDCELISRELSEKLDEQDFITEAYVLEVSSPGLTRPLKKDKDLTRNIGKEIEVKLFHPFENQKEFSGFLESFDDKCLVLRTTDTETKTLNRNEIALIKPAVHF